MDRNIIIYGHNDDPESGFSSAEDVRDYIEDEIFSEANGRYRYVQRKDADIVVLSWKGCVYGHFEIEGMEEPTEEDRQVFPPVRKVYLVKNPTTVYGKPVNLKSLGVTGIQFGKKI